MPVSFSLNYRSDSGRLRHGLQMRGCRRSNRRTHHYRTECRSLARPCTPPCRSCRHGANEPILSSNMSSSMFLYPTRGGHECRHCVCCSRARSCACGQRWRGTALVVLDSNNVRASAGWRHDLYLGVPTHPGHPPAPHMEQMRMSRDHSCGSQRTMYIARVIMLALASPPSLSSAR